ncbi:protein-glutamate O-methyltransferase CheR [Pseudomonas sp. 2FG]|uniref:CheR family methyltransferase n=1 Tax=Pseudomonas sp. 2FG TaxID=2502191 RepID=UPI0010F6D4A8|nr:protein-glutamate O-methyltransferase CheR [Pseudomonas sp. 2FG]
MSGDQRFERVLKEKIGLDAGCVGPALIARAVSRRSALLAARNADEYWARLHGSAEELQALIELVIVPETWFFRYPESFATLGKLASQRLAALNGARPLRILSLPCATGEEPYSIAMALLEAAIPAQLFQIDGLDISLLSLERAKCAIYGKNSFRGAGLEFRARHFSLMADGYALAEQVSRQVRLQCGNLLDPGVLAGEPAYDVVFCRNLLIYFDLATQEAALAVLKRLTRSDGVVFVGPAEASLLSRLGMQPLGVPLSFAFRPPRLTPSAPAPSQSPPPVRPAPARRLQLPDNEGPAGAVADQTAEQLQAIASLANAGRIDQARQRCVDYLAQHGPAAEAFYWLGLLSDAEDQPADAQDFYRKALYLQPHHQEALAHLAALLAARGDTAGARCLQDRAGRGVSNDA